MSVEYVSGKPLDTTAQVLYFGANAQGRAEQGTLETALYTRYPAAFAAFNRLCRSDRSDKIKAGTVWHWIESKPALGFMVIRESPFGATRLRYVDSVMMSLARDYERNGIKSAAIVLPKTDQDEVKQVIERWLGESKLAVLVYG